jgi:hypothetical protein
MWITKWTLAEYEFLSFTLSDIPLPQSGGTAYRLAATLYQLWPRLCSNIIGLVEGRKYRLVVRLNLTHLATLGG